ncbi:response regulator [Desulfoplanes formicivorans]|uniref:Two-component system response regulator n=1 Tax=Desulfoplanes formicivorans TaxID=1592317 RepID=A0A194ALJ8_9BACT|nr:response regulator [Desulfoplanes formicivorans]GAU09901.1 two-component system response regulator [Desulfoplanes formicivorans]
MSMKVVLVVEDDELNLKLVRELLEFSGFETLEATNGLEALAMIRKERPSLVLMDIQMPTMDGLEATRRIKADAQTRDIPVVALTSSAMKGDREAILAAGCDAYMSKPIDIHRLLDLIKAFLSGSGNNPA